jgi:DNA-binding CsgD family transcriptional regulator
MTAHALPIAPEQSLILNAWWNYRLPSEEVSAAKREKLEATPTNTAGLDWSWHILAESLREGLIVISRNMKPLYLNRQAKELCQILAAPNRTWVGLPEVISEICHKLIRNGNSSAQSLVIECQAAGDQTIRLRACWVNSGANDEASVPLHGQYILVFLENRSQILQEELQFEQKKYQFTEREMEIWRLLRQDSSYQEIAEALHISLNTVKTHVKNIYAKKRWNQEREKMQVS